MGLSYERLDAGSDLLDHRDVAMTPRPIPVRVPMAQALRDALAGSQGPVELRLVEMIGSVDPLDFPVAQVVLHVQRHVQGLGLGQPGPGGRWAGAVGRGHTAGYMRPRQNRGRGLPAPSDQEQQRCTAQGT